MCIRDSEHPFEGLIPERRDPQPPADTLHHPAIPLGSGVDILLQMAEAFLPLQILDDRVGNQIHIRGGTGEIEVFAAKHDGRAGGADMHLFRAAVVQEIDCFPHLGPPDDRIVDEQEPFIPDQGVHGDQLHVRHLVAHRLVLRHEAAGPGGGIFDLSLIHI